MTLLYELVGVAVLVLLNAFFVAAEYALVTARRTRMLELHHHGNRRARAVLKIIGDPPQFIAAMQLGVTLTSLGIGALGEHALARAFEDFMATILAVLLAYLILTFVHVVVGELVPKGVALGHAEGTALAVAAPVRAFFSVFRPLIWFLRRSTNVVLAALARAFEDFMATVLAVLLAYLVLTFVHVVVGELVPKGVALGHAEGTALAVAAPVRAFFSVFRPLIWFLRRSTNVVLAALGLEAPGAHREPLSEAELRMLLSRSSQEGEIEHEEQQMIDKVFVFGDKDAADVMVPRPEVVAVSVTLPPEQALAAVLDSPYTRYPVYREDMDDVVGVLHVRDLFSAMHERGLASVNLEELLRPAYVVPETKDLASLLQDFRRTNNHFAVVVDEYGGTAGICTLEDLIEEIVGEIEDEFDVAEVQIEQVDDDTYRLDGMFPIDEFNARFHTDLPDEDYHTVGGFVFGKLGRAPALGDNVQQDGMLFDVLEVDGSRIERMAVTFVERPAPRAALDDLLTAADDEIE